MRSIVAIKLQIALTGCEKKRAHAQANVFSESRTVIVSGNQLFDQIDEYECGLMC